MPAPLPSSDRPLPHGGNLAEARRLFPEAPEPWLDLSTGINPHPYPLPRLAPDLWSRLPSPADLLALEREAAEHYGVADPACAVAVPGTQAALALLPSLMPGAVVAVLGPTYAEHARAWTLAARAVRQVRDLPTLAAADIAVLVNPNNPDGRIVAKGELDGLTGRRPGAWLVVDEAFGDVAGPPFASLAGEAGSPSAGGGLVVLRSFGKFFGLAGVRLGFVFAEGRLAAALRARLGPWAVSGPAIAIGRAALADTAWQVATRATLAGLRADLDRVLAGAGLRIAGGTDLFRFVTCDDAPAVQARLGRAGIWVRAFADQPGHLRIGLPGARGDLDRLANALGPGRAQRRQNSVA